MPNDAVQRISPAPATMLNRTLQHTPNACGAALRLHETILPMLNLTTQRNYVPAHAVPRGTRGVPLEVEEPGDRVEGAQPGAGGRVAQATQQQHGEEERHHLQRVLVPSLLSTAERAS